MVAGKQLENGGGGAVENGVVNGMENGGECCAANGEDLSSGAESKGLMTYKRRKCGENSGESKFTQFEKASSAFVSHSEDKMVKEVADVGLQKKSYGQVCDPEINCLSLLNGSDDCSHLHWRNKSQNLDQLVFEEESRIQGAEGCPGDAMTSNSHDDCLQVTKGAGVSHGRLCHEQLASTDNRTSSEVEGHANLHLNESLIQSANLIITNQCHGAFRRLVTSEKFASLHKLLAENFQGVEVDKILDFSLLKSRMKEGVYEQKPALFSSDIQLSLRKLHVMGSEIVSLAKSLSELSRLFCRDVGGDVEHGKSDVNMQEVNDWSSNCADRWKQPDECVFKPPTCKECRGKSDGRNCLVCDSCEEMFHLSCIKPPVTEVPPVNWYCVNCRALGVESRHEECVVCERLHNRNGTDEVGGQKNKETLDELEETSGCIVANGIQAFKGSKRVDCEACKNRLEPDELFRVCEHSECVRHYHVRCLTDKQLKSYCPRWYGPCCLCRICLTDKDDDKIVLCDACDHAYHIYCMNPPRHSIPEGKWFCIRCDMGLKAIKKAKMVYKSTEETQNGGAEEKRRVGVKRGRKPKQVGVQKASDRSSGGMDMLLSAANAISIQEQMASLETELKK